MAENAACHVKIDFSFNFPSLLCVLHSLFFWNPFRVANQYPSLSVRQDTNATAESK